jgi:acyl-coenzyme A thioesterase PaaI-like protein
MLKNIEWLLKRLTPTGQLKLFGALKIPLLFLLNPKVLQVNENVCEIKVPLNYLTRNHVGSMYFGALAIGADTVVLMHALKIAEKFGYDANGIFKDLHVDFIKRAESDVVFRCESGALIREIIEKAATTGDRVTQSVPVEAFTVKGGRELVAKFSLGLSVRVKKQESR